MKNQNKLLAVLVLLIIFTVMLFISISCSDDLNLQPTNDITADVAFATPEGYKNALAKVYGSYANCGNYGNGSSDIGGIAPGPGDFLRGFWSAQELTTDEAACKWLNDDGIPGLDYMTWTASNAMLKGIYSRSILQITFANEFLRESTDAKLSERGISGDDATEIRYYVAEARFLRAFQYWVMMDFFGNPPFITEENLIGKDAPKQITRDELFNYVESELLAIENRLKAVNEYGRASQAAAWALLARLYLNAEVYTGSQKNTEAAEYAYKVINSNYSLHPIYANLFLADNSINNPEVILSINYDGWTTQNWGGTTYLINAAVNGPTMDAPSFGIPNGAWGGNRSRERLPYLFGDYATTQDSRALFFGDKPVIEDMLEFSDGLAVTKFKNVTSSGETAPSQNGQYCSVDFPLFRLAEMYLIYAEAVLRGGVAPSSTLTPVDCINELRERAYGDISGNVSTLSLDDILDERGRELYWEGFRRTDLIRYGKFTSGDYLWSYKGGVAGGMGVDSYRNLFPLSATDVIANPNLKQNPGY